MNRSYQGPVLIIMILMMMSVLCIPRPQHLRTVAKNRKSLQSLSLKTVSCLVWGKMRSADVLIVLSRMLTEIWRQNILLLTIRKTGTISTNININHLWFSKIHPVKIFLAWNSIQLSNYQIWLAFIFFCKTNITSYNHTRLCLLVTLFLERESTWFLIFILVPVNM